MNFFGKKNKLFKPFDFDEVEEQEEGLILYLKKGDLKNIKEELNKDNINEKIINVPHWGDYTPLKYFMEYCEENEDVLDCLLSMGADIESVKNEYSANLLESIKNKNIKTIETFVKYGMNINDNVGGVFGEKSILGDFITSGKSLVEVKEILKLGARPLPNEDVFSPAFDRGMEFLDLLFENKVEVNKGLEFAYKVVRSQIMEENQKVYLLEKLCEGTEVDLDEPLKTYGGYEHPLMVLSYNEKQYGIVKFLIKRGFDFKQISHNLKRIFNPSELSSMKDILLKSPFIDEEFFIWDYSYKEFKEYIESKDDLSDSLILLPIYTSTRLDKAEKKELIQMAFDKNAHADEINKEFEEEVRVNILYVIANSHYFKGKEWFLEYFIEKGSSIEFNNNSALLPAIWQNFKEICEVLLENGANLNFYSDSYGSWIDSFYVEDANLHNSEQRIEMYDFLSKYGFELEGRDKFFNEIGHEALNIILKNSDYKFASYFLKKNKDLKLHFEEIKGNIYRLVNKGIKTDLIKDILERVDVNSSEVHSSGDRIPLLYTFIHKYLEVESIQDKKYYFEIMKYMFKLGANPNLLYYYKKYENDEKFAESSKLLGLIMNNPRDNSELVELFLDNGADYKMKTSRMKESLIFDIVHRKHDTTDELRAKYLEMLWARDKFDLEERNNLNSTPLIAASQGCHYLALKWLIDKGANINVIGGFDNSPPMHKAISNHSYISPDSRAKTVEILIDAGADIEEFDTEDFTPLMSASYYGCNSVVGVLLAKGAEVNKKNASGLTALHCAVVGNASYDYEFADNKSSIIAQLINYKADINTHSSNGMTPLIDAIGYGYKEVFGTLVRMGADANLKDISGRSPLMVAVEYSDIYFVNKLWGITEDFTTVDSYGEDLFMKLVYRRNPQEAQMIMSKLIEMGHRPLPLENGATMLHIAVGRGNYQLLPFMAEIGFAINILDKNLYSPMDYLLMSKGMEIEVFKTTLDMLIKLGGDINDSHIATPLISAVRDTLEDKNMEYKVEELIKRGVDIRKSLTKAKIIGEEILVIDYLERLVEDREGDIDFN
jgi:ankyrin repeat protein